MAIVKAHYNEIKTIFCNRVAFLFGTLHKSCQLNRLVNRLTLSLYRPEGCGSLLEFLRKSFLACIPIDASHIRKALGNIGIIRAESFLPDL
jgi:hypothetical protein